MSQIVVNDRFLLLQVMMRMQLLQLYLLIKAWKYWILINSSRAPLLLQTWKKKIFRSPHFNAKSSLYLWAKWVRDSGGWEKNKQVIAVKGYYRWESENKWMRRKTKKIEKRESPWPSDSCQREPQRWAQQPPQFIHTNFVSPINPVGSQLSRFFISLSSGPTGQSFYVIFYIIFCVITRPNCASSL